MLQRRLFSKLIRPRFSSLPTISNPPSSSTSSSFSSTLISLSEKNHTNPINPSLSFFPFSLHKSFSSISEGRKASSFLSRDGNYYEKAATLRRTCPGCGVHMQESDPSQPGHFIKPSQEESHEFLVKGNKSLAVSEEIQIVNLVKAGLVVEKEETEEEEERANQLVVCVRCHSLRHYGKVKDPDVENLLPEFDFDHTVGKKVASVKGTRSVVVMVVDGTDFDGSFSRRVANLVADTVEEYDRVWKEGKSGNVPRLVLVVTKIDLLPDSISPTYFEEWVRGRAKEGGAKKVTSVHLVSSVKNWGLKNLLDDVVRLAGPRGNVWVVGSQNAGKSTLINAVGKHAVGKVSHLTEAPVPGTTLGIVRVGGVLPGQAKLFDTPGLLNPNSLATRLTIEEQALVHISKQMRPRTYRIRAGYSVTVAGLMRLDIEETTADTVYVNVWASIVLPLHMGQTENACNLVGEHFGCQLQPPIGENRVEELGKWVRREYRIRGNSWDSTCVDIAAAGVGWFSIGLKGEAVVGVWTYDAVDVFSRRPIVFDRSKYFENAGFTVSKIVSHADQTLNKSGRRLEKKSKKKAKDTKPGDSSDADLSLNPSSKAQHLA